MTEDTPFLKADRLAAFRTFFAHQAVLGFVIDPGGISGKVRGEPVDGAGGAEENSILPRRARSRSGRQSADQTGRGCSGRRAGADRPSPLERVA